jgi:predicted phage terminase large subunit-like protein
MVTDRAVQGAILELPQQELPQQELPLLAAEERTRREAANRHLIDFSIYMSPWYRPGRHHMLVAEKLEQVARYIMTKGAQGIGRLMIFEPPRHGKSLQVSRLFPAWLLGKMPDARIILASYGLELAEDDSRAVRNYVQEPRYANVFGRNRSVVDIPVELSKDSTSKADWDLAAPHRGGVIAAGVEGRIVGFGAHLLNINDPIKGRKEAESETHRRNVMTWYHGNAYTRLEDGGAIVLTHTRWDPEDLAGQLLMEMVSDDPLKDQWEIVFLPAIALDEDQYPKNEAEYNENLLRGIYIPMAASAALSGGDQLGREAGEVIWPEKYPLEVIQKIMGNILDYEGSSQYQQLPRMMSGELFDESDFQYVEKAPEGIQWYRYIDLALGKSETSDHNVTIAVAENEEGKLFLRDRLKVRNLEAFLPECRELMLDKKERGTVWGGEDVAFQSLAMKEFFKDKQLANTAITLVKPEGDKVQRARPWQLKAKRGEVILVRGSWNLSFVRIATAFRAGAREDDDIDSVSGGVQMVAEQSNVTEAVPNPFYG